MPTDRQLEVLNAQDTRTLCAWYCMLNSWGWPPLPDDPYRGLPPDERYQINVLGECSPPAQRIVLELMQWIVDRAGQKEIDRYWQTVFLPPAHRKSDEEFEKWWKDEGENLHLGGAI